MPLVNQSKRFKQSLLKEFIRPLYEPIISPKQTIVFEPEITTILSLWQYLYRLIIFIISCLKKLFKFIEKYSYRKAIPLLSYIPFGFLAIIIILYFWAWREYLLYNLLFQLLVSGLKIIIFY